MAEASWPSPGHNARSLTDYEYEQLAAGWAGSGLVRGFAAPAPVSGDPTGMRVLVAADTHAVVRGHFWTSGPSDLPRDIAPNTASQVRYDVVALRLDRSTWDVTCVVVQGTPGSGPPALTRSGGPSGRYEIGIGTVPVAPGATSMAGVQIGAPLYKGTELRPCTSTSRPGSPQTGQVVFEGDTGRWVGWTGSAWRVVHDPGDDTGWMPLDVSWTAVWEETIVLRARRMQGVVTLRGGLRRKGGTLYHDDPDGSKLTQLPAGFAAAFDLYPPVFLSTAHGRLNVMADGEVWLRQVSDDVPVGATVYLTATWLAG